LVNPLKALQAVRVKHRWLGDAVLPEKPQAAGATCIADFLFTHPMFEPVANVGQLAPLQLIKSEIA
jgi:hypothetical protein